LWNGRTRRARVLGLNGKAECFDLSALDRRLVLKPMGHQPI
jgi:hypothetical protein